MVSSASGVTARHAASKSKSAGSPAMRASVFDDDDVLDTERLRWRRAQLAPRLSDEHARARIAEQVADLLGGRRQVDRERHRAEVHRRGVDEVELGPVEHEDADAVARANALRMRPPTRRVARARRTRATSCGSHRPSCAMPLHRPHAPRSPETLHTSSPPSSSSCQRATACGLATTARQPSVRAGCVDDKVGNTACMSRFAVVSSRVVPRKKTACVESTTRCGPSPTKASSPISRSTSSRLHSPPRVSKHYRSKSSNRAGSSGPTAPRSSAGSTCPLRSTTPTPTTGDSRSARACGNSSRVTACSSRRATW